MFTLSPLKFYIIPIFFFCQGDWTWIANTETSNSLSFLVEFFAIRLQRFWPKIVVLTWYDTYLYHMFINKPMIGIGTRLAIQTQPFPKTWIRYCNLQTLYACNTWQGGVGLFPSPFPLFPLLPRPPRRETLYHLTFARPALRLMHKSTTEVLRVATKSIQVGLSFEK